jgi:hypothetical protein
LPQPGDPKMSARSETAIAESTRTVPGLPFRRQYLLAPVKLDALREWTTIIVGQDFYLHAHPDLAVCEAEAGNIRAVLAGFMIDPSRPEHTSQQVLRDVLDKARIGAEIPQAIFSITGRWALFLQEGQSLTAFHDACGLRPVFFFDGPGRHNFWCSSEPGLLAAFAQVKKDQVLLDEFEDAGGLEDREYWWPAPLSGFAEVNRLPPNHSLTIPTGEVRRYWPKAPLSAKTVEECAAKVAPMLTNEIQAAALRQPLAITLTAGLDTRVVLAASKAVVSSAWLHTWLLPSLSASSPEVVIPRRLLAPLGLELHVLRCNEKAEPAFAELYQSHAAFAHPYWRDIAAGLHRGFPEKRLSVKGNCSEVGRCFFYHEGYPQGEMTIERLAGFQHGWTRSLRILRALGEWFASAVEIEKLCGIRVLDLFYWEHRLGCWQANSQVEWDLAQETFCPFNNRNILAALLSVPEEARLRSAVHFAVIRELWPELLEEPINPKPLLRRVRHWIKKRAKRLFR